nr:MAG TPA: hypothetical protein [Caudoviricetes sp.]
MATDGYDDALPKESDVVEMTAKNAILTWANLELRNARAEIQIVRDHTLDAAQTENVQLTPFERMSLDAAANRLGELRQPTLQAMARNDTGISLYVGADVMTRRGITGAIVYATPDGIYLMVHKTITGRLPELCWYSHNGRAIYDVGIQHDIVSILPSPPPEPV